MKTTAMSHQALACERSVLSKVFAFLFEQGCGKTWAAICDAEMLFNADKIDAMVVIAPKGVHTNWTRREIPTHMSLDAITYAWNGKPTTKREIADWDKLNTTVIAERKLRVLSMNIDALNTKPGQAYLSKFLGAWRCVVYMDESSRIKNPSAARTKHAIRICRDALYRRILNGTPITKGPIDLFSQFDFLKPGLLGTKSYRAFVAEYAHLIPSGSPLLRAIMEKSNARFEPQIVETDSEGRPKWKNLDRLAQLMAPYSHRVRKIDCLDLPPKLRKTIYFQLEPAQRKVYEQLARENEFVTDLSCHSFEAIAARSKMKQVTSGFININGEPLYLEKNPRMDAFRTWLDTFEENGEDADKSVIIWSLYSAEHRAICEELEKRGLTFVEYVGATKEAAREAAIDNFQAKRVTFFVANEQAAGIGLTLTAADYMLYMSFDYDLGKRMQSEDRSHRKGRTESVVYVDFVAELTLDEDIVASLSSKDAIANEVTNSDILLKASGVM